MSKIIYRYHGGVHRGAWPHIPARDLTQDDLNRLEADLGIVEKDIEKTGLYDRVEHKKNQPKSEEVSDG